LGLVELHLLLGNLNLRLGLPLNLRRRQSVLSQLNHRRLQSQLNPRELSVKLRKRERKLLPRPPSAL
jgi:hypothetical protein